MRKNIKRLFAILMTLAIAITAIPMMEAKAEENYHTLTIYKIYPNTAGEGVCEVYQEEYTEGTSFGEIYDKYISYETEQTLLTDGFQGWDLNVSREEIVDGNSGAIRIIADYETKNMVEVIYSYVENQGEYGIKKYVRDYVFFDNSVAESETLLNAYFSDNIAKDVSHLENLDFSEWEVGVPFNWDNDLQWDMVRYHANYSNEQVILATDSEEKVYVANPNETIALPSIVDGYEATWECSKDGLVYTDSYTVPGTVDDDITLTAILGDFLPSELNVSITFDSDTLVLTDEAFDNYITATATVTGTTKTVSHINSSFINEDGNEIFVPFWGINHNDYTSEIGGDPGFVSGEYKLSFLDIYFEDGTQFSHDEIGSCAAGTFTVSNSITDQTAPVVTDISMSVENGSKIKQGSNNKVTITFKITDEGLGIDDDSIVACLETQNDSKINTSLANKGNGVYEAAFLIDDSFGVGEWYLHGIHVEDKVGNYTYHKLDSGEDFYFYVTDENGVYEPIIYKDITLYFYDLDGDVIATKTVTETGRKATITELMGEYPVIDTELGFVGWSEYIDEQIVKENTKISISYDEEEFHFHPVTEKSPFYVTLYYLDNNGEFEYEELKYIVDDTVKLSDIIAQLPTKENAGEYTFTGWDTDEYKDMLNTPAIELGMIYINAAYDKYPVEINRVYIDQTGKIKSEEIVKNYLAGTKIEDIIEEWTKTPSDASTDPIIEWTCEGWYGSENETISLNNSWFSFTAKYDDKIIVEFTNWYIQQDNGRGKEVYHTTHELLSKDMCKVVTDPENSELKDYFKDTYSKTLDVTHYDKLEFLKWDYKDSNVEYLNGLFDNDEDGFYDEFYTRAVYNEDEVILTELQGLDGEYYVYVVNPGDEFNLEPEYDGYNIKWYVYDEQSYADTQLKDGKFTVPGDAESGDKYILWYLRGDKVPEQVTPPGETTQPGETTPPNTADTTTAIPYAALLLLGAGVLIVGCKRRNFVR